MNARHAEPFRAQNLNVPLDNDDEEDDDEGEMHEW
jgi:hypothetical protein